MKVTSITAKHPMGFDVTFELEEDEQFSDALRRLASRGYTAPNGDGWRRTPEGLPICPVHHEVMQKREKQGDEWHSHKVTDPATGEIHFCRGYPHATSTGYHIR